MELMVTPRETFIAFLIASGGGAGGSPCPRGFSGLLTFRARRTVPPELSSVSGRGAHSGLRGW